MLLTRLRTVIGEITSRFGDLPVRGAAGPGAPSTSRSRTESSGKRTPQGDVEEVEHPARQAGAEERGRPPSRKRRSPPGPGRRLSPGTPSPPPAPPPTRPRPPRTGSGPAPCGLPEMRQAVRRRPTADPGHREVHHDDVRAGARRHRERLHAVSRLRDRPRFRRAVEGEPQSLTEHRVVVREDDAHHPPSGPPDSSADGERQAGLDDGAAPRIAHHEGPAELLRPLAHGERPDAGRGPPCRGPSATRSRNFPSSATDELRLAAGVPRHVGAARRRCGRPPPRPRRAASGAARPPPGWSPGSSAARTTAPRSPSSSSGAGGARGSLTGRPRARTGRRPPAAPASPRPPPDPWQYVPQPAELHPQPGQCRGRARRAVAAQRSAPPPGR